MTSPVKEKALQEAARLEKKFTLKTGSVGSEDYKLNVVPTGILALDYALGTGGWPLGHPVEIFGEPDIGKSTVLGFSAIKSAQEMGMLCGIIALEPGFDKEWAYKNGVDPETVVIARPDNGETAFEILHDWTQGDVVDFIVFDSIGAVVAEVERKDKAKVQVGGQSSLITTGVKKILTPTWKNNKGLIFLNQQRDDMNARHPSTKTSPGGNAIHHSAAIRVQLRGKDFYKTSDDTIIGRALAAIIIRNKLAEGSKKKAEFDYYQMDAEGNVVGIDVAKDVVATAMVTGVIKKAGAWYRHPSFPTGKHQLQGKDATYDFLLDNDKVIDQIRNEVIEKMFIQENGSENGSTRK